MNARRWRVRVVDVSGKDLDYRLFVLRRNAERYARDVESPVLAGRAMYTVTVEPDR